MKYIVGILACLSFLTVDAFGQKIPLDHSVYDNWQDIGKMDISADGAFVFYEVTVQKGDGTLYLQSAKGDTILKVPRGENGRFSKEGDYFICNIAKPYREKKGTKERMRGAKKEIQAKAEQEAGDSLMVFDISSRKSLCFGSLGHYEIAGRQHQFVVWLTGNADSSSGKNKLLNRRQTADKPSDVTSGGSPSNKKDYTLQVLRPGMDAPLRFDHVQSFEADTSSDYVAYTVLSGTRSDSLSVCRLDMETGVHEIIFSGAREVRSLTLSEQTAQPLIAFLANGVRPEDTLGHQNDIYLWQPDKNTQRIVDYNNKEFPKNWEVSPYSDLSFSRSGKRLFFEVAPEKQQRDTTVATVDLDIWNTKRDILFTEHKTNADRLRKKGYLTVCFLDQHRILQLEDSVFTDAIKTYKGDGDYFYLFTDTARRIDKQWLGYTRKDYYMVNMKTGVKSEVVSDLNGRIYPSFRGARVLFYDREKRQYALFNATARQFTAIADIGVPLYDEQYDRADDPPNYGVLGWDTVAGAVYVYDRYDIWKIESASLRATLACVSGRKRRVKTRLYLKDRTRGPYYFNGGQKLNFNCYYEETKNNNYVRFSPEHPGHVQRLTLLSAYKAASLRNAARHPDKCIYTLENYRESPQVYISGTEGNRQLSAINGQQDRYLWGRAELFEWRAPTGKHTQGIVYLPENLDTTKKYPMITYFYERRNQTLYNYIPPKPTGSALNISFFVSQGYVVFVPDIWYTIGHPGRSAYDYVLSGIKNLGKKYTFIDSANLGVQGQSWGGYQVAYLVTRTNMFKAAWAGAPVVDMFSAYGGIRWKTGSSRAMQYEKGQSRIGVTPWENKGLYIENSPLFFIPKIKTPIVIMSNDGDGAVPWYQGIEFFMALRRFGKQAWLLNYRGEEHNLIKRENREDIQRKEAAYFDWQLKGAPRPSWTF